MTGRRAALAAALLALSACRGGGAPHPTAAPATPSATSTPTPSATPSPAIHPPNDADAGRIRRAVAVAVATCPCLVKTVLWPSGHDERAMTLIGLFDAKRHAARFVSQAHRHFELRIVAGTTYVTNSARTSHERWVRLDYARVPRAVRRAGPLAFTALADPELVVALGATSDYAYEDPTFASGVRPYRVMFYADDAVHVAPAGVRTLLLRLFGTGGKGEVMLAARAARADVITAVSVWPGGVVMAVQVALERADEPLPPIGVPSRVTGTADAASGADLFALAS